MSNCADFYMLSFVNKDGKTNFSKVRDFFEYIDKVFENEKALLQREINGKIFRCFNYSRMPENSDLLVIPFGKVKDKNKPYVNKDNNLEEIPEDLYQVNCMVIDYFNRVVLITVNREGPDYKNIQDYLNTFLEYDKEWKIEITPIYKDTGLNLINNAKMVKSVILNLDLSSSLNKFYNSSIDTKTSLIKELNNFTLLTQQTLGSKKLNIEMGLGYDKKDATMNIECVKDLLTRINIDENFVKEIIVRYKNNKDEKIDTAKLKETFIVLRTFFPTKGNLAPDYLLYNCKEKIEENKLKFWQKVDNYLTDYIDMPLYIEEIKKEWDPKQYYE